ncbi:hypothetical protein [Methylobacterium sp. 190mf]|uniref:hypothetical protein n=1 Tax=Methylobacterium sp. 190mf TaxID=1761798 RepID=UPI0011AFE628|nr:hypothetical protein [Methylobacterium sp. 190mf]
MAKLMLGMAAFNIMFAALDYITSLTGTAFLLDPIRNADYELHLEENVGGLRRIVGSFTETSLFSYHTIGLLSYTFSLTISNRWTFASFIIFIISLILLLLSTSGTAYVALAPMLLFFYVFCFSRSVFGRAKAATLMFTLFVPLVVANLALIVALDENLSRVVTEFVHIVVFTKSQSESGVTRAEWNRVGMMNFYATYGLGSGFGTTRASSWIVAVLSSTGLPGLFFIGGFFWACLRKSSQENNFIADIQQAARIGCFGYIVAGAVSFSLVDLRLPFFVLAALAAVNLRQDEDYGSITPTPK